MNELDGEKVSRRYEISAGAVELFNNWMNHMKDKETKLLPEDFTEIFPEIEETEARTLLYVGVKEGILKTNYDICCPECQKVVKTCHRQLDIPDSCICNRHGMFKPMENKDKIMVSFSHKTETELETKKRLEEAETGRMELIKGFEKQSSEIEKLIKKMEEYRKEN